jgi:hypothetical protein
MVAEQGRERAAAPHRHALPASVVLLRHGVGAASRALYGHPLEVVADVCRVSRAPYLHLHPMVACISGRAVQVVAHVAHVASCEGMGFAGCGFGVLLAKIQSHAFFFCTI